MGHKQDAELLRAVLDAAEYRIDMEWLRKNGVAGATALGKRAAELTLEMRDERDALRQRAEAAEAERDAAIEAVDANWVTHQAVAEARAQAAAAWEAAAAWVDAGIYMGSNKKGQAEFSPMTGAYLLTCRPADASAALTARLDAELERAALEADGCPDSHWGPWIAKRIRALRR